MNCHPICINGQWLDTGDYFTVTNKYSGEVMAREGSKYAIEEMTETKLVVMNL